VKVWTNSVADSCERDNKLSVSTTDDGFLDQLLKNELVIYLQMLNIHRNCCYTAKC
jgi:hypothetical protein